MRRCFNIANSVLIDDIKTKVIHDIINDPMIVRAINAHVENPGDLINTHIFRFHQNANVFEEDQTFLTVQVHIPRTIDRNKVWVKPVLEIWVLSHNRHMVIDNIPKVTANRNDFISQLVDKKFNGRTDFGFGQLVLERNIEGVCMDNRDFIFRQMLFETRDFNQSVCRGV